MTGAEPNELADLLAPYWSASRASEALQITEDQLAAEVAARRVLGVSATDGATFFPAVQFEQTSSGLIRVKPGLGLFMTALADFDPWTIGVTILTPMDELDETTPVDWLRRSGDPARLARLAHVLRSEWR